MYCPNCHKKVETEKVLDKELKKKKTKCMDCGSVLKLESGGINDRLTNLIFEATMEELKKNLPDVEVEFEGEIYKGQLRPSGALAKVVLYDMPGTDFQYSWDTILKAVNSGQKLIG